MFFATFGTASLALSGFLYLDTRSYGRRAAFEWVGWESKHLLSLAHAPYASASTPRRISPKAGAQWCCSAPTTPTSRRADPVPRPGPRRPSLHLDATDRPGSAHPIQRADATARRRVRLVSRSAKDLEALEKALVETFVWGMAATVVIGLIGAVIFGAGSLRQNDAITGRSSNAFMRGDLSERLPTRGVSADLAHLTGVVNDMLGQLERLMLEIKGVNENIAHDLRTPLTRVVGTLERSLRKANSVEAFRACNEDALAEVKSIVVRFSALLRISEMEDRLRRSASRRSILPPVGGCGGVLRALALERQIRLRWERPEEPCTVGGGPQPDLRSGEQPDRQRAEVHPAGGEVEVALRRDPPGIRVTDTGCGIPANELGEVRERYRRGH